VGPAQRDVAAPKQDPRPLMQELATLRARAVLSGRTADLEALDAPGSPALERDTADLRRAGADRLAYEGVRLTVRSARAVTVAERSATIEAVVDTAAYRVVSTTGGARTVRDEEAARGQALRFALVWSGDRWLVDRIEPVS
jgi:eukaryotic-like serine/threonine-protein kinase